MYIYIYTYIYIHIHIYIYVFAKLSKLTSVRVFWYAGVCTCGVFAKNRRCSLRTCGVAATSLLVRTLPNSPVVCAFDQLTCCIRFLAANTRFCRVRCTTLTSHYSKRTHSVLREHLLFLVNTFYRA